MHRAWLPLAIAGLIIGAVFISIYVGLQRDPQPSSLPVAVVGEQLARPVQDRLGGAVAVREVDSLAGGRSLVREGVAVAVLEASAPGTLTLEYAGAAGSSESSAVRALVSGFADGSGSAVVARDVVPLARYDQRGLSSFYVVFGVTLSSFILAQGLTAAAGQVLLRHRLGIMAVFALLIGTIAASIAGPLLGALRAPFLSLALCLALLSAATAFATKALGVWFGPVGISLAVLTFTTVGNATSGATIGVNLLPAWARVLSDVLPAGAAVRAVTGFGYFGGAGTVVPLLVLCAWFVAGAGLVLVRHRRVLRVGPPASQGEGVR